MACIDNQLTVNGAGESARALLLLSANNAALMLGIRNREFSNLDRTLWLPRSLRLGRRKLWRVAELAGWYDAGCPERTAWESDPDGEWRVCIGNRPYPKDPTASIRPSAAGPYLPAPAPRAANWWRWREPR